MPKCLMNLSHFPMFLLRYLSPSVVLNQVISGASSIQVTLANDQTIPAQVTGTDPVDDLAVIKITPPAAGLTTVALGDSSQLRAGQEVLAIGSPLGSDVLMLL